MTTGANSTALRLIRVYREELDRVQKTGRILNSYVLDIAPKGKEERIAWLEHRLAWWVTFYMESRS